MLKKFVKHLSFINASDEEVESIIIGDMDHERLVLYDVHDTLNEIVGPLESVMVFLEEAEADISELYVELCDAVDNIAESLSKE